MRIDIRINDETIKADVKEAVAMDEDNEYIKFPDATAKKEFIEEVVESIITKIEIYDEYFPSWKNVTDEMQNLAGLYGYMVD